MQTQDLLNLTIEELFAAGYEAHVMIELKQPGDRLVVGAPFDEWQAWAAAIRARKPEVSEALRMRPNARAW